MSRPAPGEPGILTPGRRRLVSGDLPALTWDAFLVGNLLPVTLGNVVGGGVMIGVLYWTILDRPKP